MPRVYKSRDPGTFSSINKMPSDSPPSTINDERPRTSLRLRGRYYFLTYPRCEALPDVLANHLENIGSLGSTICRERHADGMLHLHAAVDFGKRRQFNDVNSVFDLNDGDNVFHGNYQVARSWNAVHDYVCKGDDITYWGTAKAPEEKRDFQEVVSELVSRAKTESYETYLIWCCGNRIPYGYCTDVWRSVNESLPTTLLDGPFPGTMINFFDFLRFDPFTKQSLVIQGASGIGKTTWAKRQIPKPALMCSDIDDLKHFRRGYHVSILFDDMCFKGTIDGKGAWPRTSQIHLVDMENDRSIRCRHRNAMIPAGVFRVFTCNEYPFSDDDAISRRVQYIQAW